MERRSFQSRTASLAIATAIGLGGVTAQAMDVVVYKAIPDPVPPNIPSLGVEAYSMPEIGDRITLQPGGPRNLKKVEVLLSSWACESGSWNVGDCSTTPGRTFTHPITLNLYNADGSTLGSVTQEFTIPYRPSASGETACPSAPGKWYDPATGTCSNGKAVVVTFDAPELFSIVLPETFVFGIAYNTRSQGYVPIGGASGPSDSLNVGLSNGNYPVPYVGTDANGIDGLYWYTKVASWYCDSGVGGTSFRDDDGCWDPYGTIPVNFVTAAPPTAVNLQGFDQPVDDAPMLNKAKSGQAVPLKFYVATAGGLPVTNLSSAEVTMAGVNCSSLGSDGTDPVEQYASGNSGLINQGGGYYQFNLKTAKGTTGCQVVTLALPQEYASTPDRLEAFFQFFK
jgi:hypothetical protein